MTEEKPFWKSKTLWLNLLALIIVILTGIENAVNANISLTVITVMNIILRAVTKEAVKWQIQ